jgi:hypothetical protein
VTRDIDQISVSVGPAVTRDYRIDRNGTVCLDFVTLGDLKLVERPIRSFALEVADHFHIK